MGKQHSDLGASARRVRCWVSRNAPAEDSCSIESSWGVGREGCIGADGALMLGQWLLSMNSLCGPITPPL
jgi:hypothetical protein